MNHSELFVMWLKRATTGLAVMTLCFMSVVLIMCGVTVLELDRKVELIVFILPASWVAFASANFLILRSIDK